MVKDQYFCDILSSMKQILRKDWFIPLLLTLFITTLVYSNIFRNQFMLDDLSFFPWASSLSAADIPSLLSGATPHSHEGVYRPIRGIFYLVMGTLFGLNPLGHHIFSLLIHLTNVILVFAISYKLFNKKTLQTTLTTLLFALHPHHPEAITYLTTAYDIIGINFSLASFYTFIISADTANKLKSSQLKTISITLAVLAFFTYELTLTLPIFILLYLFTLKKHTLTNSIKKSLLYFIQAFVFLFLRFFIFQTPTRGNLLGFSYYTNLLSSTKSLGHYFFTLLFPFRPSFIHNFGGLSTLTFFEINHLVAQNQSPLDSDVFLPIIILISIIFLAFKTRKKHPTISFALFWLPVSLLPVLNFIPTAFIYAEKYTYTATIAASWLITILANHFFLQSKNKNLKALGLLLITILISSYGFITYHRNSQWDNQFDFVIITRDQNPDNPFIWFQLGQEYQQLGEVDKALEAYTKTIELYPYAVSAYKVKASIHQSRGEYQQVIDTYQSLIKLKPEFSDGFAPLMAQAHAILSQRLEEQGDYEKAKYHLEQSKSLQDQFDQSQE